jgi:hypothetical protein
VRNLLDDWERQILEELIILAVIDQDHDVVVVPVLNILLKHLVNHLVPGMLYQLEHPAFHNGREFLPANRQQRVRIVMLSVRARDSPTA